MHLHATTHRPSAVPLKPAPGGPIQHPQAPTGELFMHPYPHVYTAGASAEPAGPVPVTSPTAPDIATTPPPQFDGPEGYWSPETLLTAAVANCFVLSFRAIARPAKFEWRHLDCKVTAILEKVDGVTQFSRFETQATLTVASGADEAKARQLLEKAEHVCLISNSLRGARHLEARIVTA
jgi:organic hydroperoxide reductase OsmC/OhrA